MASAPAGVAGARVSVVVVSRGRPRALLRALCGLSQLLHPAFEVIVVADPAGLDAIAASPRAGAVKAVPFDEPNISAARNLGLARAAGGIVAFLDDDAVPEPTWLDRLAAPFARGDVDAAGGAVRGRNGISWQWRASVIEASGRTVPLAAGRRTSTLTGRPGRGGKTEGTNMAFRRDLLAAMGGFDPAFRFYLDEADLNLRLAAMGRTIAFVPGAEVHHGFLASARRRANRVPTDLTEIGASLAAFHLRHDPRADPAGLLAAELAAQRARLRRHVLHGRLTPWGARRLLRGLAAGFAAGLDRAPHPLPAIPPATEAFRPFPTATGAPVLLTGRLLSRRRLLRRAEALAAGGGRPTLVVLSRTARPWRVTFLPPGIWLHRGGINGPSERSQPLWRRAGLQQRLREERARIASQRGLD
ncbi:glycosyltransferase family 2 protein [Wenxinia saemankumensis]|uniref:Glycosyltransferase, GT2 family n=1 Tax=Wenxinia saemankumensis TaxID=1447782 RepID=A0A1M6FSV8_9RHOB|nr:glycosyltransferase [Wenxinia saemankumensis]SHJ00743.1 Glycosyltransferase, GT2 family [Wenxinia saemankumensis]